MKKIALLGLSLLFTLGSLAQETKTTKEVKKVTTEQAEKNKKEAEKKKKAADKKAADAKKANDKKVKEAKDEISKAKKETDKKVSKAKKEVKSNSASEKGQAKSAAGKAKAEANKAEAKAKSETKTKSAEAKAKVKKTAVEEKEDFHSSVFLIKNRLIIGPFITGHLCEHIMDVKYMDKFGVVDHEKIGAAYLLGKGFSEKIAALVASHVEAKRYLTLREEFYYASLSAASKKTLEFQGGIMSEDEANTFESDPLFSLYISLRKWDEKAKLTAIPLPSLDKYKYLMQTHLLKQLNLHQ